MTTTQSGYGVIDAVPPVLALRMYAGDDFHLRVDVYNKADRPVDLTGATAQAQIRFADEAASLVTEFITAVDGHSVHLHLAGTETATLPPGAVWDLQITFPNLTVLTIVRGTITLTTEVTK